MFNKNMYLFGNRFVFANEALGGDVEYSATPQINVDEGPSDIFSDKQHQNQAASQQRKKDEAKAKKQDAPDTWVRIVIYLAFKIDIGGEGTIEEAIAALTPEQRTSIDNYVAELEKVAKAREEQDRLKEEERKKKAEEDAEKERRASLNF